MIKCKLKVQQGDSGGVIFKVKPIHVCIGLTLNITPPESPC